MDQARGIVTLWVTVALDMAQPADLQLRAGEIEPSQILSRTSGELHLLVGLPVRLVVEKSGAVRTPYIGTVQSVVDGHHRAVGVDAEALQTVRMRSGVVCSVLSTPCAPLLPP